MTEDEKLRLEYFQKHALPWQLEHVKFRSQGLQLFIAIQGALLVAWANLRIRPLPAFALIACFSFWLWDQRNREVISRVHKMGRELADRLFFPPDGTGEPTGGVHVVFAQILDASGPMFPRRLGDLKSHTWAIRSLLLSCSVLWLWLLISSFLT